MIAKYTPGPWKRHIGRGANPRWHIQTSAGYQIASTPEISRHKPEAEAQAANAALLAAAPDLLGTLETMLKWFERESEKGNHYNSPDVDFFDGSMEGYLQKKIVEANGSTWEEYCKSIDQAKAVRS